MIKHAKTQNLVAIKHKVRKNVTFYTALNLIFVTLLISYVKL